MNISHGKRKANDHQQAGGKRVKSDVLSQAPRELDVVRYAESHASEIQVLSEKVATTGASKNIGQKMPPHMRRRALSHNVRRLPRSIRGLAGTLVGRKLKKPSRYHRRRPKNLLQEYNRRQRKHVWLETHIWHAKRFHMVEKWGYKLPWKPTMKSERACYRATTRHCLLQDQSYMSCIEIQGPQEVILEGLSQLTDQHTGCAFAAKSCLSGLREGHTILYEPCKYPMGCIGPVLFLWNPQLTDESGNEAASQRQLWVWCHPCSFNQVWEVFLRCLNLTEVKSEKISDTSDKCDANDSSGATAGSSFICDKYKTDVVALNGNKCLQMVSLTGSLLRFCLTGPESVAILVDVLQQANIVPVNFSGANEPWWKGFYGNQKYSLCHVTQREFVESIATCQAPSELPPHCVFAMTTRDPRLTRPSQRTKVLSEESNICQDVASFKEQLCTEASFSPLWNKTIRDEVSSNIITDHKINELKSQNLVPGFPLELGDNEARIPVIVIQRPGVTTVTSMSGHNPNLGRGSGFDVLLPKGWGMAFWLALVFRGARCAGLRERECNAYEEKSLLFPHDFPDTSPGLQHQLDLEQEKVNKYNRIPPAKRPNFTKFGVVSPFLCPWDLLVNEWQHDGKSVISNGESVHIKTESATVDILSESSFCVLRDFKVLRRLLNVCHQTFQQKRSCKGALSKGILIEEVLNALKKDHSSAIVPVQLDLIHKGSPDQFSMICIPTKEDLIQLGKNKNYSGPVETIHDDPVLAEKKTLKREMKKSGVKGRVKVDRNLKMVRDQVGVKVRVGARDLIGYLNSGGFCLGTGGGGGLGFVAAVGLAKLLNDCVQANQRPVVLVRDNSSLQYRFARLSVIV